MPTTGALVHVPCRISAVQYLSPVRRCRRLVTCRPCRVIARSCLPRRTHLLFHLKPLSHIGHFVFWSNMSGLLLASFGQLDGGRRVRLLLVAADEPEPDSGALIAALVDDDGSSTRLT